MSDVPPPSPVQPAPQPAPGVPPPGRALPDLGPPRRKSGMPAWAIVLIVLGVLGIPVLAGLIGTVAIIVPQMQEKQKRFQCANNLSMLGGLYVTERVERPKRKPRSGPGLFLEWRKDRTRIASGEESVLVCPGDVEATTPDTAAARSAYDSVNLDRPPRDMCSYAVRDFAKYPIPSRREDEEVVAACLHHRHGANVLFDNGSCRFFDLEALGIASDEDKTAGPDSKVVLFRVLTYGDDR